MFNPWWSSQARSGCSINSCKLFCFTSVHLALHFITSINMIRIYNSTCQLCDWQQLATKGGKLPMHGAAQWLVKWNVHVGGCVCLSWWEFVLTEDESGSSGKQCETSTIEHPHILLYPHMKCESVCIQVCVFEGEAMSVECVKKDE